MNSDLNTTTQLQDMADHCTLGLNMQVAARFVHRLGNERCLDDRAKPPFIDVLCMIERHPGIRQGLCAESLGFDATTFGRYVDRLARNDLVQRDIPKNDRRSVTLSLTARGRQTLADCRPVMRDLENEMRDRMGAEDWAKLSELLERFLRVHDHPLTRANGGDLDRG